MLVDDKGNKVVPDAAKPYHSPPFPRPGFYLVVVKPTDDFDPTDGPAMFNNRAYGPFGTEPEVLIEAGRIDARAIDAGEQPPMMLLAHVNVFAVVNDIQQGRAGKKTQDPGLRMVAVEREDA